MNGWVIAAPASGSGKTSLTLGLVRACVQRGLRVQCFKVGPDFLDPTYLSRASGQPCFNLDPWMSSPEYIRHLYNNARQLNDIVFVEGVMGLFDGASPTSLEGSTAEVAQLLGLPVLFVVPAGGMARSICATVQGFHHFAPDVELGGVIANFVGSAAHGQLLATALAAANLPPLLGALPKDALPTLPGRHLGLIDARELTEFDTLLNELAQAVRQHVNLDALLASTAATLERREPTTAPFKVPSVRIGIAQDAAFRFAYADNLHALEQAGVRWVPFSPLRDRALPPHLDGLYFPGGYPEVHAWTLAANRSFLDSVRTAVDEGVPVYAECGGLMYLCQGLTTQDGVFHQWVGLLPTAARMLPRRKALGYTEVNTRAATCWGPAGSALRGHEFHYSELEQEQLPGWENVYDAKTRSGSSPAGYQRGRVLASYVHLHWAARPDTCANFVRFIQGVL